MASEIRVNQIQNRSGLGTITVSHDGFVVSGIVTANSFSGVNSVTATSIHGTGISTFNEIQLDDNKVIKIGNDGDLQLSHNGTDSFIQHTTAASLKIRSANGINLNTDTTDDAIACNKEGSVEIYFHNNKKFETTGSGTITTGIITALGGNLNEGSFLTGTSVGVGTTTTTGRNAGVGTANGTLIYNSTGNKLEIYADNAWKEIQQKTPFNVSGGTVSNNVNRTDFVTHTFTSPGNFVSGGSIVSAEIFVIGGGGGGGGNRYGGGGGAGGAMLATGVSVDPGTYAVSIGSGGNGGPGSAQGSDGGNTIFNPGGAQQRQGTGGGGGASYDGGSVGRGGGSGGGASSRPPSSGGSASQPSAPGSGTDYGNRGGNYNTPGGGWCPAGGGGAAAQGVDSPSTRHNGGGNGGAGVQLSISGTATYYGGGGGASAFHNISPSPPGSNTAAPANHKTFGGAGGGGTAAGSPDVTIPSNSSPGVNATANTGSGGAGTHSPATQNFNSGPGVGGNGAAGLVIIAYPTVDNSVLT